MARTMDSLDIRQMARDLSLVIVKHLDDYGALDTTLGREVRLEIAEDIEDTIHDTLAAVRGDDTLPGEDND